MRTPRAAGYVRVSTDRQADEGMSIQDQKAQIERFAESRGIEIVRFYEDAHSGAEVSRPLFQEMLAAAKGLDHPFDHIIVYNSSRFFRDNMHRAITERDLQKHKVSVLSVMLPLEGSGSQVELLKNMLGSIDEFTSRQNAENVIRCMRENAKQGFFNGSRPPFGYTTVATTIKSRTGVKKILAVAPDEAETVRRIFSLAAYGENGRVVGMKTIASKLREEGRLNRGRNWTMQRVHDVLHNEAYIGKHVTFKVDFKTRQPRPAEERVVSSIPPIVDEELFKLVQNVVGGRKICNPAAKAEQAPSLLTGLAKCGLCGAPLMVISGKTGQYRYYRCSGRQKMDSRICTCPNTPQALLESSVLKAVAEELLTPSVTLEAWGRLSEVISARRQRVQQDLLVLERERGNHREKLQRLYEAISEGKLALDGHLRDLVDSHEMRIKAIDREVLERERDREMPIRKISPDHAVEFAAHARKILSEVKNPLVRPFLRALVSDIVVTPTKVSLKAPKLYVAAAASRWDGKNLTESVPGFVSKWRPTRESNPS